VFSVVSVSTPVTDSTCHQQNNQHEENDPAKTTADHRATQVKTAAAEQQQKDYQQNDHIHGALLSGFREAVITQLPTATISHDSLAWLFRIEHNRWARCFSFRASASVSEGWCGSGDSNPDDLAATSS
jgi:hypothetical protein